MELPKLHVPTKSEVEASNMMKRERAIMIDIRSIDRALAEGDESEIIRIHRYIDGKYQHCIAEWGKSMYGYTDSFGFAYDMLSKEALIDNLSMMKPKLEAFIHGWNVVAQPTRHTISTTPDVNVTVNNNVSVNITFDQVRSQIEEMTSLTSEETKEALEKVSEIESVAQGIGSKKTKWEKLKPIFAWLADKSFDVAMTILPLLLKING